MARSTKTHSAILKGLNNIEVVIVKPFQGWIRDALFLEPTVTPGVIHI